MLEPTAFVVGAEKKRGFSDFRDSLYLKINSSIDIQQRAGMASRL
jgi:hypothetical protein